MTNERNLTTQKERMQALIKKGVATYNKAELLKIFNLNNILQPKAKYSNNVIINALEVMNETTTIKAEATRNLDMINRGSVIECLVKSAVIDYIYNTDNTEIKKSNMKMPDLDTSEMPIELLEDLQLPRSKNIEIKFSTSFANATKKENKARFTIVVNQDGAYLVKSTELTKTKDGHIKPTQEKGVYLEILTDMLGF